MKNIIVITSLLCLVLLMLQGCSKDDEAEIDEKNKIINTHPNFEGNWTHDQTYYTQSSTNYYFTIWSNSEASNFTPNQSTELQSTASISGNTLKIGTESFSVDQYPANFHAAYWDMIIDGERYIAEKSATASPDCNTVEICIVNNSSNPVSGCLDCSNLAPRDTIYPGQSKCYPAFFPSVSTWGAYSIETIDCKTYLSYD
jgi:hypothetical protein